MSSQMLYDLRLAIQRVRNDVLALTQPGQPPDNAWFDVTGTSATDLAARISSSLDRTVNELRALSDSLRGAFDLLTSERGQAQQRSRDKLQTTLSVLGALVLGPSVLASLFGMEDISRSIPRGFEILAVFVSGVVLTALAFFLADKVSEARRQHRGGASPSEQGDEADTVPAGRLDGPH